MFKLHKYRTIHAYKSQLCMEAVWPMLPSDPKDKATGTSKKESQHTKKFGWTEDGTLDVL